jgi:Lon-like ATP-dependent protease
VSDLGEEGLPEPSIAHPSNAAEVKTVESQDPDVKPASEKLPGDDAPSPGEEGSRKEVTTQTRRAMKVPDSVHVSITRENLKDYVGP